MQDKVFIPLNYNKKDEVQAGDAVNHEQIIIKEKSNDLNGQTGSRIAFNNYNQNNNNIRNQQQSQQSYESESMSNYEQDSQQQQQSSDQQQYQKKQTVFPDSVKYLSIFLLIVGIGTFIAGFFFPYFFLISGLCLIPGAYYVYKYIRFKYGSEEQKQNVLQGIPGEQQ